MSKGGSLLGTVLNVVSLFVPALKPVAMVVNTALAIESGNPLALAQSAMGWADYSPSFDTESFSGSLGDTLAESGWSPADYSDYSSVGADMADFAAPSVESWADANFSGYGGGALGSDFAPQTIDQGLLQSDPQSQVQAAMAQAQTSAMEGGVEAGIGKLGDIFGDNVNIDSLEQALRTRDASTLGGFKAAGDAIKNNLNPGIAELSGVQDSFSSGGINPLAGGSVSQESLATPTTLDSTYGNPGVSAFDPTTSWSLGGGQAPAESFLGGGTEAKNDFGFGSFNDGQQFQMPDDQQISVDTAMGNTPDEWGSTGSKGMGLGDMFDQGMDWIKNNPMKAGGMALKGIGGLNADYQNRKALRGLEGMFQQSMAQSDPFAGVRGTASNAWTEAVQNPDALWQRYMAGQGGADMQTAAAQYAKAGRRNMLPRLQSDMRQNFMANYVPNYMKAVNPGQFPGGRGAEVGAAYAPHIAALRSKQNGNFGTALGDIFKKAGGY